MIWDRLYAYQAATMCKRTYGQKLSDMENYSELDR